MRKLILEEWISVDGYVADKKGKLDFFSGMVRETYSDAEHLKFLDTIDLILLGRKTYQQFVEVWPGRATHQDALADKMNTTKKIVFSNTLTDSAWGNWPPVDVVSGDAFSTIKKLKALPGKNLILWGSVSLAQVFMKEDLIDEYLLHVCPTLTYGGRRLFTEAMNPTNLTLLDLKLYGTGTVFLKYQPIARL